MTTRRSGTGTTGGPVRSLWAVLAGAGGHARLLAAAVLAAAAELAGAGLAALSAWLIARAAQQPPMGALSLAVVAVRALAVTKGVFRYGERLVGHDAALRAVARLRRRVFGALARGPLHGGPSGGDAVSRAVSDVDVVQDALLRVVLPAASALLAALLAVGVTVAVSPAAALALAAGLLTGGALLPALTALATVRADRRTARTHAELAARAVDLAEGAADLQVYGAAARESAAAAGTARRLREQDRGAVAHATLAAAVLTAVQGATTLAVALVCARAGVPAVWAVTLPLLALAVFEALAPLPAAAQLVPALTVSAHRVHALLRTPPDPAAREAAPDPATPVPVPAAVHLTLRGVGVRHGPGAPFVLRGADLDLPPGRRVAVLGASGAGKSTLLSAIARLVPADEGEITLDGDGLATLPESVLRRRISGVLQDAHVFRTSLRNNLLLAQPGSDDAALHDVLRAAGLGDWADALPDGLDTLIGPDGNTLSGGQRRRLLLARALLAAPPLLLLDEPTENLDAATADAVLAAVLRATEGRSLVLVTHRRTGLEAMDEILVMDGGSIERRGTPAEILGTPRPVLDPVPTPLEQPAPVSP
ncbi:MULTISPECIES: thiol reductant ABC exporter subunit CydC [unclassified Streptomyces]|uniref:thiol reductant ABC exporter subunit CydC n=1 Tax=unclassified Streptomyces TaxID=2593676 RepID=UPI0035DAC7C9